MTMVLRVARYEMAKSINMGQMGQAWRTVDGTFGAYVALRRVMSLVFPEVRDHRVAHLE